MVGWPEGIKLVQNLCTSRNINAFAMKFARAVIEKDGMQKRSEKKMKEEGILIKTYAGVGRLGTCLRVTTGAKPYMQQFLDALNRLDQ